MKELIYLYLIVGCYIAHRKTSNLDVNSVDFLKTYLKFVFTYPKDLLIKLPSFKKKEDTKTSEENKE